MQRAAATGRLALGLFVLLVVLQTGKGDEGANLLIDGGGERAEVAGRVHSPWYAAYRPTPGVRLWIDHENARSGGSCFAIANELEELKPASNNWAQTVAFVPSKKTVRVSAYAKTEGAANVNVCVQCWGTRAEKMIGFVSTPVIRGTHDWMLLESPELTVPAETERLVVRAALTGVGRAFFDDLSLRIVGSATPEESNLKELVAGRIVRTIEITKDAMVLSYLPEWRHGEVDNLGVANNNGGVRTLMDWEWPTDEELAEAGWQFWLMLYVRKTHIRSEGLVIQVHEVEEAWPEVVSWTQQPRFRQQPTMKFPLTPGTGWKAIDVSALIRGRGEGSAARHGVVLRFQEENQGKKEKDWSGYQFASREAIGQWEKCRPVLLIVEPARRSD